MSRFRTGDREWPKYSLGVAWQRLELEAEFFSPISLVATFAIEQLRCNKFWMALLSLLVKPGLIRFIFEISV